MFTGIVDHCGQIEKIERFEKSVRFTLSSDFTDLVLGESIAVDGACLTVTSCEQNLFNVDLSPETMQLTSAASYKKGVKVNLERSLRLTDRLGGHFVTGHIDGTCRVSQITPQDEFIEIVFHEVSKQFASYLIKKGSIALNGVSLTLNEVNRNQFKVMLIPHTLQRTNLATLQVGDQVNVEFDYLAKLVINQLSSENV